MKEADIKEELKKYQYKITYVIKYQQIRHRAMIYLALNADTEGKIGIKKISGDLKIPSPFLAKILQVLAKHKLLSSTKGPNGGFRLAKGSE